MNQFSKFVIARFMVMVSRGLIALVSKVYDYGDSEQYFDDFLKSSESFYDNLNKELDK